jgi:peptidoglycan/LPS O-acetylase OafA/YrhL
MAALFVVFVHAFYEPSLGFYTHRWLYLLGVSYHRVPVDVFIVLSGFCLMLPIARRGQLVRSWRAWFVRRSLRILPPYYAAVLLSLGLSVFLINPWAHRIGSYIAGSVPSAALWAYAFQIQDIFDERYLQAIHNPPLWSIAVEWRIYFIMPLVLWTLRSWGALPTLLWTVCFGLGVDYAFGYAIGKASPWYVALFAMGAIAARSVVAGTVERWWRPASLGCVGLFGVIVTLKKAAFYNQHAPYFGLLVGAGTALFIGASAKDVLAGKAGLVVRLLSSRPLVALGLFSYSLYLTHNPMLRLTHLAIESLRKLAPESMLALLLAATPLYLLAAYLFHIAVERPFMGAAAAPSPSTPVVAASASRRE